MYFSAAGPRSVGAAAHETTIKAPLSVQVALPRMLAPGDRTTVPVTLKNHTGAAGAVAATLHAKDGIRVAPGFTWPMTQLAVGEVKTIDVPLVVDQKSGKCWKEVT